MIREAGAEQVIIGHSERRTLFGETDETVNRKTRRGARGRSESDVCIGETLEEREAEPDAGRARPADRGGLDGVTGDERRRWWWPTSRCGPSAPGAPRRRSRRRRRMRTSAHVSSSGSGRTWRTSCHVLYGGSVKPDNMAALMAQPDVDGALVGGASLDVPARLPTSFEKPGLIY